MEVNYTVDWLSFTRRASKTSMAYEMPSYCEGHSVTAEIPRFGYRKAVVTDRGVVIMYDGATATMGQHFIYSGSTIGNLMVDGVTLPEILEYHAAHADKCTRIDLAIDVHDYPEFLPAILAMTDTGKVGGASRSATIIRDVKGSGLTIYFGSRTSEKFVRIYDKASERGEKGLWARIEAELKGDRAKTIARALSSHAAYDWPLITVGLIETTVNFDCEEWRSVMGNRSMTIANPQPDEPNTEEWLLTQVVSAIAKFERKHPEKHITERICQAVDDMLGI